MEERIAELEQQVELLEQDLQENDAAHRDTYNMLVKVYRTIGGLKTPAAFEDLKPIYEEMQKFLKSVDDEEEE